MRKPFFLIKEISSVLQILLGEEKYAGEMSLSPPFSIHPEKLWGKLVSWRNIKDYTSSQIRIELFLEPPPENPESWLKEAHFMEFEVLSKYPEIPLDHWGSLSNEEISRLNQQERHIREEVVRALSHLKKIKSVYDPMCSSGSCIYEVARAFPQIQCFGSDIRPEMVEMSEKLNASLENVKIFHHDATLPFKKKADVIILRGLVCQVSSKEKSLQILQNAIQALKVEGHLFAPAVAPMNIQTRDLQERDLEVLSASAWNESLKVRFPFFIAKKKKALKPAE